MKINIKDKDEAESVSLILSSNNYYTKLNIVKEQVHGIHPSNFPDYNQFTQIEVMGSDRDKSGELLDKLNEFSKKVDDLSLENRNNKRGGYCEKKKQTKLQELESDLRDMRNQRDELQYNFKKLKENLQSDVKDIHESFRDLEREL